jgi:hypothetical protein
VAAKQVTITAAITADFALGKTKDMSLMVNFFL